MGTHFQKNSEIAANSKHFPSSFWKKLNVFLCNFFAIKWEFDKMGTFFRISCYFGAKWEPILSRAYCIPTEPQWYVENDATQPLVSLSAHERGWPKDFKISSVTLNTTKINIKSRFSHLKISLKSTQVAFQSFQNQLKSTENQVSVTKSNQNQIKINTENQNQKQVENQNQIKIKSKSNRKTKSSL